MNKIRFKRDTAFRKTFFVPDSFAHPAKMDAQLLIWIVNKYTEAGETILDPMAGSGTLMLSCTMGRNVILVELEEKFCKMMWDNWEQVKMRPQLGSNMGTCQIIKGDARQLEGLLKAGYDPKKYQGGKGRNLQQDWSYHPVDSIITSPPYENQGQGQGKEYHPERMVGTDTGLGRGYSDNIDNIGNLKPDNYLEAMLQVYQQCYKVLKPQGLMVLVTKNFIRDKQVVRLDTDTIKLCEQAGFSFVERYYRELPSQSFWRIIYHQKYPNVEQILNEDVLVFNK